MRKLTNRQKRFVQEYLLDLNATQAAIRAGYSENTAQEQSSRLLSNVMIKAGIARMRKEAENRTKVRLDLIIQEYARFAFAGLSKFIRIDQAGQPILDLSRCTPEDLDLLAELRVDGDGRIRRIKIKQLDKLKALEALGKHLGLGEKAANGPANDLSITFTEVKK